MRGEVGVRRLHHFEPWYQAEQDGASSVQLRKKPKKDGLGSWSFGLQIEGLRLGGDTYCQGAEQPSKT